MVMLLGILLSIGLSLTVSHYIYDRSDLYSLNWLDPFKIGSGKQLVTINAGFDETSALLAQKYPDSDLTVFDFYDPAKHTEVSIERARKRYSVFPGTKTISSSDIPLKENSVDCIFLILSAHEIRNLQERIEFFGQLQKSLRTEGRIVVVEHLRDSWNFFAYNIGFFHFFSKESWLKTFEYAALNKTEEIKLTPFISAFILNKNGTAS